MMPVLALRLSVSFVVNDLESLLLQDDMSDF